MDPEEDLPSRALLWLHNQPANSHLPETKKLASLFPNGPRLSDDQLDIIICDSEGMVYSVFQAFIADLVLVLELVEGLNDPDHVYKRKVKKGAHCVDVSYVLTLLILTPPALDDHLERLPPALSPSDLVHSSHKIADLLGGDMPSIHLGRPGGAPVAIFNPALASLQRCLDNLEEVQVSRSEVQRAAKYLWCAVAFYEDEAHRQRAIKELVNEAIGEKGEWGHALSWADNIKPDGSWWYDSFLILVLELNNTLGLSGDALLRAVIDYSKIFSRDKVRCPKCAALHTIAYLCLQYKRFREYCNFPIVLLGVTANRLEISVAVCVGPIYVTKFLTLDLSLGFHASNNIIRLARVFGALSRCRLDLHNYYDRVSNLNFPRLSCLYPNPTLVDRSKTLPTLTYRQFLSRAGRPTSALVDLGNATTSMYIATLGDTDQEVIVKFTARYNEVAHRLLADADLAPKLHFCERVIGDLYMVIMDRVDGTSVWQLQEDKKPVPAIVLKGVRDAVHILHANDIVFGDLREPNILYLESRARAMLVDFDGCGQDGKDRYPATLNPSNAWAEDVSPYSIMCKAHDTWQLDRLAALC